MIEPTDLMGGLEKSLVPVQQAQIDRAVSAAHSRGWCQGATDVLDELERARCFTTNRARRTVARIRSRLNAEPR